MHELLDLLASGKCRVCSTVTRYVDSYDCPKCAEPVTARRMTLGDHPIQEFEDLEVRVLRADVDSPLWTAAAHDVVHGKRVTQAYAGASPSLALDSLMCGLACEPYVEA